MPAKIQELIARNIRTLSNSMSNKPEGYGRLILSHMGSMIDLKELKERWLTKKEQFMLKNERTTAPNMQSLESPRTRGQQQQQNTAVGNAPRFDK